MEAPEELDIRERLADIDGMTVSEQDSPEAGYRLFLLAYEQPSDHDVPGSPTFGQRMTLLHRDEDAPTVMVTAGYYIDPEDPGLSEPTQLLAANQLVVEHRFFPPSRPEPADWSTLTIAQAAADHHRVATALQAEIYGGPWISTGGSKSGMAAVYFKRFYPDDVAATIAYVAPNSFGEADPRYLEFVATRGAAGSRAALLAAQREVLVRRPAMLAAMAEEAAAEQLTYDLLTPDGALDSAVLEFIFTFWQYETAELCAEVPAADASDADIWEFLGRITPPWFWSDQLVRAYEPYYWQAAVELGYPAYDETNLDGLLMFPGIDVARSYVEPGPGKQPTFDADAMPEIAEWLDADGAQILFVYGENDPYTAAAFEPSGAETFKWVVPGGNHSSRILDLPAVDRADALAALADWTGVSPQIPRSRRRASARTARLGQAW
jgi:hypothetical protein